MNPRFDLPPEVMLGERVVKPVAVKPPEKPVRVVPGVLADSQGRWRTDLPLPVATLADRAMLDADLGKSEGFDIDMGATCGSMTAICVVQGREPLKSMSDGGFPAMFGMSQVAQRQQDQARDLAQLADQKSDDLRRGAPGPHFRVTRKGVSTTLAAPWLTDDEVRDLRGTVMQSRKHHAALKTEVERMDTFIAVTLGGDLRQCVSLRQATDAQLASFDGRGTGIGAWSCEMARRGL